MSSVLLTIAVAAFIATNVDDLFLLAAWFVRRTPLSSVIIGQLAGFTLLMAISLAFFWLGISGVPEGYLRWLGFVPIAIGVRNLLKKEEEGKPVASSWISVATITAANGADNIGVYVPLFLQHRQSVVPIIAIFYVGLLVWIFTAKLFEKTLALSPRAHKAAHWIAPVVMIIIGVLILLGF